MTDPIVAVIPKAAVRDHQLSNLAALELRLGEADVAALDTRPKDQQMVGPDFSPDWDTAE